jgi:hypothetical protein
MKPFLISVLSSFLVLTALGEDRPNVLFIAVDDLRDWARHLGGHPNAKTPNIDRLAKRGISFTRAYCSAPLCNPSRISLLTGIAPFRSGVYGNGERLRNKLPDAVTLMQHFRASGYSARGGGKIFHGTKPYDAESWDNYFIPPQEKPLAADKRDPKLSKSAWTPWGPLDCDDEDTLDGKTARWITSELEKPQAKPFFLAFGITKPHLPWRVPRKYFDLHPLVGIHLPLVKKGDLDDLPAFGKKLCGKARWRSRKRDREQSMACRSSSLSRYHKLCRCPDWQGARCAGSKRARRQYHYRSMGRPRLAPGRKGALAQACLVGCFNPDTSYLFNTQRCGERPTVRESGQPDRYLPHAH